jgi:predicted kinase
MKKLIICRGIQGSGKTTWAKGFIHSEGADKWVRINRDDIRNMLGDYWIPDRESLVTRIENEFLKAAMFSGYNIISDNMNLNPKTVEALKRLVLAHNAQAQSLRNPHIEVDGSLEEYEIEFKDFFIPLEEAIVRDSLRPNPIGERVIRDTYKRYRHIFNEEQLNWSPMEQDSKLPHAVILDLDGTVALNKTGRPYWGLEADMGFLEDECVEGVAQAVRELCNAGKALIVLTGRTGTALGRENTLKWLDQHFLYPDELIMREPEDYRKDEVTKKELFEKHIAGKYHVDVVFEDRNNIVKMWRDMGLLCFQVWDGKF